ncbi:MarR family transcriptional regulator [Actinomadura spongiicola]|uniref:MarR family transcriptional regulator n=1 Tax=Actinomadura spongiicola TaxID=2303421 RepID=A0A372GAI9_9ACTN|nr:MarR family winged helix-turn-helix transcriptional regulator [Actinomadura spongiicola]RFS82093.1 MarR family transcriptional regulator [Actinomadura spongiicola]
MTSENGRPRPPVASTSIVVLSLARRIESELNTVLAPLGLTVGRLGLLGHIAAVPGASFSDLARMSGITVQSAHGAVKALVAAGLVRDHNARAGSASTIELTEQGHELLDAAQRAVAEVDERVFGPDSPRAHQRIGDAIRTAFADPATD